MPTGSMASAIPALPDLSTIRALKGISLQEIAQSTKITKRYLEAIERSDFDKLPGGVFRINYIRQYARAIDYDEWDLLAYYRAMTESEETTVPAQREHRFLGIFRVPEPIMRLFAPEKRA